MAAVKGISKLSGQAKASTYPQPEGVLGDCMLTYGKKMGDDSVFGIFYFIISNILWLPLFYIIISVYPLLRRIFSLIMKNNIKINYCFKFSMISMIIIFIFVPCNFYFTYL